VALACQVWLFKLSWSKEAGDREMVDGLLRIDQVDQVCDSCMAGKQRWLSFPSEAKYHTAHKLELVHDDLCGPVTPTMPTGKRYFFLPMDDVSRYTWLTLLETKGEASAAFKRFQTRVEAEVGRKVGTLQTDHGGEFTTRDFLDHCIEHRVQHHFTMPYTPEQNGVVERRNQSILGMARSMLKAMSMSGWLWGEAVATVVFILNRSPTQSVEGRTPYEVWHDTKPSVQFFRTFGCVAHIKQGNKQLNKLEDRSISVVFIGYEPSSKAWRFYNPATRKVHVSRDVVFEEDRPWNWEQAEISDYEPFSMEYVSIGGVHGARGVRNDEHEELPQDVPMVDQLHTPHQSENGEVEYATPPSGRPDIDAEASDAPLRFRRMDDILGQAPQPRQADRQVVRELLAAIGDEPALVEEAFTDRHWR
jgi:hypothetical protein